MQLPIRYHDILEYIGLLDLIAALWYHFLKGTCNHPSQKLKCVWCGTVRGTFVFPCILGTDNICLAFRLSCLYGSLVYMYMYVHAIVTLKHNTSWCDSLKKKAIWSTHTLNGTHAMLRTIIRMYNWPRPVSLCLKLWTSYKLRITSFHY